MGPQKCNHGMTLQMLQTACISVCLCVPLDACRAAPFHSFDPYIQHPSVHPYTHVQIRPRHKVHNLLYTGISMWAQRRKMPRRRPTTCFNKDGDDDAEQLLLALPLPGHYHYLYFCHFLQDIAGRMHDLRRWHFRGCRSASSSA